MTHHDHHDWMEYCVSFVFPSWASNIRPCSCCNAFGEGLYNLTGISIDALPWHVNTDEDYIAAARRCEIYVRLDADTRVIVAAHLFYDKRPGGHHGRVLRKEIRQLLLMKGDRLEPSMTLPDVSQLETMPIPAGGLNVTFWRDSMETLVKHNCPLWSPDFGITPTRCLVFDVLHAFYLGVLQCWAKWVVWLLLKSRAFGPHPSSQAQHSVAISILRGMLLNWYSEFEESNTRSPLSQLNDLTMKMLGTAAALKLKMRAAETFGFTIFLIRMLEKYSFYITGAGPLIESGQRLVRIVDVISDSGVKLSISTRQDVLNLGFDFQKSLGH